MNEVAKALWDLSVQYLEHAGTDVDTNTTICYTGMAEIALQQAEFAVKYPSLVAGEDAVPLPPGMTIEHGMATPAGPTTGPRLWGAPKT